MNMDVQYPETNGCWKTVCIRLTHRCHGMLNLTWSLCSLTWQCPLEDNKMTHRWCSMTFLLNTSFVFIHVFQISSFVFKWVCRCFRRCVIIPVWHPRWTVLLLFGTFRSDSECLYRAPVKMAFICFLWAASSCSRGQPAVLDHRYTWSYDWCCVNTIDIQGVDLPLPWCWAPGQICAAPVGVSLPSPRGKHVATSQSAPAEDIH